MQLTNRLNLPAPLVAAIENDPYDSGASDITVTQLIRPPRQVALEALHRDKIIEDASERIYALCGQIGHTILERAGKGEVVEKRVGIFCHDWFVSCAVDLWLKAATIIDYKFTSVWTAINGPKSEWIEQLNIQRLLCIRNALQVNALQIVAIYRDWSKLEARRNHGYPPHQVQVFDLPVWSLEEADKWLSFAVLAHQAARKNLPECTPAEMWEKPTRYAVKKRGNKRATSVYDTMAEAEAHVNGKSVWEIEVRPGERTRCESYCSVAPFCEQFQAYKAAKTEEPQASYEH